MCFGSKAKEQRPPPPTPPTTFDYDAADRGSTASQQQLAAAQNPVSTSQASFGSELSGTTSATATPGGA